MSYREFTRWVAYRHKRGSLHPGMRMEHAGALIASILANVHSKKDAEPFSISDFMEHVEERPITMQEAMATWR